MEKEKCVVCQGTSYNDVGLENTWFYRIVLSENEYELAELKKEPLFSRLLHAKDKVVCCYCIQELMQEYPLTIEKLERIHFIGDYF